MLGWPGHEHQWRGGTELFEGRANDVARIYQSDDPAEVAELLERYGIRYVYQGSRERDSYGDGRLHEFGGLLRTAFEGTGVRVYEKVGGPETGVEISVAEVLFRARTLPGTLYRFVAGWHFVGGRPHSSR